MGDEVNELMQRLQVVYSDVGGKGAKKKRGKDRFDNLRSDLVEGVVLLNEVRPPHACLHGSPSLTGAHAFPRAVVRQAGQGARWRRRP